MSKFWIIALNVYKKQVRSAAFLIMVLAPLVIGALYYGMGKFMSDASSIDKIGVYDQQRVLANALSQSKEFEFIAMKSEKSGEKQLAEDKIDAFLVLDTSKVRGLNSPREILDAGNSGTTTRLIAGILAGQKFISELDGDASLRSRPMKRIMDPLNAMGADIRCRGENNCLPLRIVGHPLTAIHYTSPVASAQVKSCVLLAGMYADGVTSVTEPFLSRNHTEIMLRSFGADIRSEGTTVSIRPEPDLLAQDITVPGDISSAAFFIAAGLLTPGSEILLKNVGINPTRAGILKVCQDMGADITLLNADYSGEPAADILVRTSSLKGTVIQGADIPTLIDELPIIAVMAAFAGGTTVIRDAAELRVKESDRIAVMTDNLRRMGADVEETEDGMIIHGGRPLHGAVIDPRLDHRVAMSFAVAGTVCEGTMDILDGDCVRISYPDFYKDLYSLG